MRKKYLDKKLLRLKAKRDALTKRALESQSADEVRSINDKLSELNDEIADIQEELDAIAADEADEQRNDPPADAHHVNADIVGNTVGTFTPGEHRTNVDPYSTMEYRTAFKSYVQRGTPVPTKLLKRSGGDAGPTVTEDIGLIVPTTIMNEFIKKLPEKAYGKLYAKARKLNVKGGVKFPISDLKANFKWITETTVSPRQKAGDIKEYVQFLYNIGEVRVSQTLLSSIEALEVFESQLVEIMLEAYIEAQEKAMLLGTGEGQPLGILNDTRITNVVELTEAEFSDWKQWRKKLFAKVPLSLRRKGEFVFPVGTVESNLMTMADDVGRPIFKDAAGVDFTDDSIDGKFFGREVNLVEPDVIVDFDEASAGDVVGVYFQPKDYAFNTQLIFGIKRYFDEETNQWVNKGITVTDGKMLDVKNCWIIKKK